MSSVYIATCVPHFQPLMMPRPWWDVPEGTLTWEQTPLGSIGFCKCIPLYHWIHREFRGLLHRQVPDRLVSARTATVDANQFPLPLCLISDRLCPSHCVTGTWCSVRHNWRSVIRHVYWRTIKCVLNYAKQTTMHKIQIYILTIKITWYNKT